MFSGNTQVELLDKSKVNRQFLLSDINRLLAKQHSRASGGTNGSRLLRLMEKGARIVIARNGDERTVGMAVLIRTECLTHTFAAVHHFVIHEGQNVLPLGMEMIKTLTDNPDPDIEFFEAGVWLQDRGLTEVLKSLGFKEKPGTRFRLRLPGQDAHETLMRVEI